MLEKMTHDDLLQLTSVTDGPCVSLYIPALPEKNMQLEYEVLVRQATYLLTKDPRSEKTEEILADLYKFNPSEFLKAQDPGIVLFVNKHWKNFYVPAHEVPSKVVVADSFHLRPLLEDLQSENMFNILALSPEEAIFLHCNSGACSEVHHFLFHHGAHSNSIHWTHYDEGDTLQIPHLKSHMRGRGTQDSQNKKRSVKLFIKWIEAKINKEAGYQTLPLYIFTSEAMFPYYTESTSHAQPQLLKIDLSKGLPRTESLTHQAKELIHKQRAQHKAQHALELEEKVKQQKVIDNLVNISKAALKGRVQTLFLQKDLEIWGELHRKSGEFTIHEKQQDSHDDDILDDIACEVLKRGGEVVVLSKKDMPTRSPASAILSN